jgi:hypothetical protein
LGEIQIFEGFERPYLQQNKKISTKRVVFSEDCFSVVHLILLLAFCFSKLGEIKSTFIVVSRKIKI